MAHMGGSQSTGTIWWDMRRAYWSPIRDDIWIAWKGMLSCRPKPSPLLGGLELSDGELADDVKRVSFGLSGRCFFESSGAWM